MAGTTTMVTKDESGEGVMRIQGDASSIKLAWEEAKSTGRMLEVHLVTRPSVKYLNPDQVVSIENH